MLPFRAFLVALALLFACSSPRRAADAGEAADPEQGKDDEDASRETAGDASDPKDAQAREPAASDAAPSDASSTVSDGGRLPPGPAVEVTTSGAGGLQARGGDVCWLDLQGDIQCRNLPPIAKLYRTGPFRAFGLGSRCGCAIGADDLVRCWTDSGTDSLCTGAAPGCSGGGKPPAEKFAQISVYNQTACGVTLDGRLLCWGDNDNNRATPPAGSDFASVKLAYAVSCALRRDGSVSCWAPYVTSGISSTSARGKQVAIGDHAICVLGDDGSLNCVGSDSDLAKDPAARDLAQISVERSAACGLTKTGAARCWSLNSDTFKRVPPPVGPFKSILVDAWHACGLRGDGQIECWGEYWGNGGGAESCLLNQLRVSLDGQAERSDALSELSDDRGTRDAGLRSSGSGELSFFLFDGADPVARELRAAADAGVSLRSSLWLPAASDSASGELYCSGPDGSDRVQRHDDELTFEFKQLALLGQCPGSEPVAGTLSACFWESPCATSALTGDLRGESKNVPRRYEGGSGITSRVGFADGTIVLAHEKSEQAKWGLIVLPPDAAGLSEVLCAGSVSKSGGSWTFGGFTSLGRCKGGGAHMIKGCLR